MIPSTTVVGKYGTIAEIFQDLRRYYASSGRNEDFIMTLYGTQKLYQYYKNCNMPAKNIIIVDNLWCILPNVISLTTIMKYEILILVFYFDDIKYYTRNNNALKQNNTLTKKLNERLIPLEQLLNLQNDKNEIFAWERQRNATFFSKYIGMSKVWLNIFATYSNVQEFNILDITEKHCCSNEWQCSGKILKFINHIEMCQSYEKKTFK